MRIAVIGAGISGLSAAWLLSRTHDVTVYERDARIGGHANTVDIPAEAGNPSGTHIGVDTGFIVYNTANYPNLIALFDHLGVETAPTAMSFAASFDDGAYEYSGSGLGGMFGQRRNVFRPGHWRMIADLMRFFKDAEALSALATSGLGTAGSTLVGGPETVGPETVGAGSAGKVSSGKASGAGAPGDLSLGNWLAERKYSSAFIERHIVPMGAAIWSTPGNRMLDFPAAAFARFFSNHGLLQVRNRPQWRTVRGGSRNYVAKLVADGSFSVRAPAPVAEVVRSADHVTIATVDGHRETYDACVLACHGDVAHRLLIDRTDDEADVLGAFTYSDNRAVLHRDRTQMPQRERVWASWNYMSCDQGQSLAVSYWMNSLQPLSTSDNWFVTLNPMRAIEPELIAQEISYRHPVFDQRAMAAQQRLSALQGARRTWFCGSYFGFGFHEDGIQSGLAAAEDLAGELRPWAATATDALRLSDRLQLPQNWEPRSISGRKTCEPAADATSMADPKSGSVDEATNLATETQ